MNRVNKIYKALQKKLVQEAIHKVIEKSAPIAARSGLRVEAKCDYNASPMPPLLG